MQFDIPFIESLMPPEILEEYHRMNERLRSTSRSEKESIMATSRHAIETVRKSMEFLKAYCRNNLFQDEQAEILFFKFIKPCFHANLVYWMAVFEIELSRPAGGRKREMKFLKKRMEYLYEFFERQG